MTLILQVLDFILGKIQDVLPRGGDDPDRQHELEARIRAARAALNGEFDA